MPSFNDINGQSSNPLSPEERNYVREILGVSTDEDDPIYTQTQQRFNRLTTWDVKTVRYWMGLYGSYGDATDVLEDEGVSINVNDDRARAARALFNKLFASGGITPLDDVNVSRYEEGKNRGGTVHSVPVSYGEPEPRESEY